MMPRTKTRSAWLTDLSSLCAARRSLICFNILFLNPSCSISLILALTWTKAAVNLLQCDLRMLVVLELSYNLGYGLKVLARPKEPEASEPLACGDVRALGSKG